MTKGHQVVEIVSLQFRQCLEFVGHCDLVVHLEIEAGVPCRLGFVTVSPTYLAGVSVAFEYLMPNALWIEALQSVSAIVRIRRRQSILAGTQTGLIYMRVDRPPELIAQLADSTATFRNASDVVDLFSIDHPADVSLKKSGNTITGRSCLATNRVRFLPRYRLIRIWLGRLQPVGTGSCF